MSMVNNRDPLTAPGVSPEKSDKDRAIALARQVCRAENQGTTLVPSESLLLARQFLRALGISERG